MTQLTQLKRLGLFDARVPRYTSYPTAPHFAGGVGPDTTAGWLQAIPEGGSVSVYLHIPFCRRLCWFCACRTQGTATAAPVAAYVESLKTEIATIRDLLPRGVKIEHLHWGGGTPTLLTPDMIADLSGAIRGMAPFQDDAVFSVEIDPNEVDQPRIDALARAGMTRASIGVQDFDQMIQDTIGRPQTYETTKAAVDGLRAAGITSLNVDILYGLPHQTRQRIAESVQLLLSLAPDRVALFGYAHVPWMAKRQAMIPTDALPAPEERLELYETARRLFLWDGFVEIGIDHFARPGDPLEIALRTGRIQRNFQGYTEDTSDTLIGIGASAISRYPQGYAQNDASTSGYQAAVRAGELATRRGHAFSDDDRLRGRIIEVLMCHFEVNLAAVADELGFDRDVARATAQGLDEAFPAMLSIDGDRIVIRREGRPLTRMIARYFDAYEMAKSGHSPAI